MPTFSDQLKEFSVAGFEKFENEVENLFEDKADKMVIDARNIIKVNERIDTGALITDIESFASASGITLISDGTIPGNSFSHASFNEFGTDRMSGINHVKDSFNQNIENIDNEIDKILGGVFGE